ncbi:caspase domain-containing protein [Rhizobium leguminosarum]|uniref:caspase family protein n=1 Tax=Rhizobium leguminosarum TaxID=384 RepID=UPI0021BC12BD|nr:caspase family protein [Rhizobium leguminosarum]
MQYLRIALTIFLMLMCSQAFAEKRVALVVGNSAYQHVPTLPNPKNDAGDMAAKLRDLGFVVVVGNDLDLAGVRRTISDFVDKLDGADMALFYYAGHGLQVNGENYIAPVDAKLLSYIDLEFEAVPMNLILSAMERTTRVNLVFLDACRDNPLAVNLARSMGTRSASVGRGLARVEVASALSLPLPPSLAISRWMGWVGILLLPQHFCAISESQDGILPLN